MNVWATVSNLGAAVGLIVGGVLTTYASWRWTLFINVPVGALVGVAAPFVLADSPRRLGRLDLAGAATVTGGVATLTYALSSAAPSSASDHAHWGDADVIAACVAGLALVGAFALVESRIRNPAAAAAPRQSQPCRRLRALPDLRGQLLHRDVLPDPLPARRVGLVARPEFRLEIEALAAL